MNEQLEVYLGEHLPKRKELFIEMEQYARAHHIPIMELTGIELLLQLIRIQQPERILEIGTAIGYSALRMADVCPDAQIITIERNEARSELAEQFIRRDGKEGKITIVHGDARETEPTIAQYGSFDLLFLDAAKGQYQRFFNMYEKYVKKNGVIITDNVLFQGYVYGDVQLDKRKQSLVEKVRTFNKQLVEHPNYDTVIVPIGDGIAISKKRGESNDE